MECSVCGSWLPSSVVPSPHPRLLLGRFLCRDFFQPETYSHDSGAGLSSATAQQDCRPSEDTQLCFLEWRDLVGARFLPAALRTHLETL